MNQHTQSADVAYWVAVPFWGQGLATEAVRQLIAFCRLNLHLHRLKSGVLQRNPASRRVLEKNQFHVFEEIVNTGQYADKFYGERFWQLQRLL